MESLTDLLRLDTISMLCGSDAEYEEVLNSREPAEPREGVQCPKCGNHEYTWIVRDGERYTRECECKKQRDSLARIRKSGLAEQMQRCTFESFDTSSAWQETAKRKVLQFCHDKNRGWLLLCGQSGAGKSHLCTAAAAKFLKAGASVRYMRWVEQSTLLKSCVSDDYEYLRRIKPLRECRVLYVDDFWKTQHGQLPTPADVRLAFDLLDYRYCNRGLITIISTERTAAELMEIDPAVGGRIYEMSEGYRLEFSGIEKNYRMNRR